MTRSRLILPVLLALLAAPSMVSAQTTFEGGQPQRDPLAVYKEVGINAEQEAKIRQLSKEFEDASRVRDERVKNLMGEVFELSLQPAPDEATVLAKQDEMNKVQAEKATERVKLLLAIRNVLTAEQKQRLVTIIEERTRTPSALNQSAGQIQK
ncbi:MAG: Spy/CpxP family protein refolding chaperone [Candidatus Obscuribacterales bacterium]|nr:Spy/CpxP family protein refolding chaperone [Candidatus Obscuribacterales bacterium]